MFPIRDNIPSETFPFVNYGIIISCVLVFLMQLSDESREGTLTERFAMVPARLTRPSQPVVIRERGRTGWLEFERVRELARPDFPVWLTTLTCIFLHGELVASDRKHVVSVHLR
ncbi:MAG: hypothetical protein KatS3mg110_3601 [Pirellulaceae bacterium]|nr:MAG: hypothetical protein KatS3mg110_3601 [Pirellulaceae bacterium]